MTPNPTAAFEAFARREVDADDVFRLLVGFDNYLAPPAGAPRGVVTPPDELWVYTDTAAVTRAKAGGSAVGPLTPGMSGLELFHAILPDLKAIRVNPVSPAPMSWSVPSAAFPVAQAWVNGVRFETEVARTRAENGTWGPAMQAYRHYLCYLTPEDAVLTMPGRDGFTNPAVVCTAPDCGRRVLERVPADLRAGLRAVFVPGTELAEKLPRQGVDGVVLNPAGPGPTLAVRLVAN